ncbi:hypothetical protein SPI_00029 [Niveomyces insectorum RCEF 264]|uniref:Uncharacterized protein n=1 Tax=Niveomyces insectorum RCEF 264 TaxID=1081102 RepID=A0A167ZRP5_9HYPO|nr:hypothetical protein SPI_00029 [Niveomyces insectorum RCEF 264]
MAALSSDSTADAKLPDNHLDDTASLASSRPPAYDAPYDRTPPLLGDNGLLDAATAGGRTTFYPTLQLQIDTTGKRLWSLPGPLGADPICVYAVHESAQAGSHRSYTSEEPAFISLRASRRSGTCSLVTGGGYAAIRGRGGGSGCSPPPPGVLRTLSTTTYRFGPGRDPTVALLVNGENVPVHGDEEGNATATRVSDDADKLAPGTVPWDTFSVEGTSLLSRAKRVRTRLGTFEWRYAGRAERKAVEREMRGPNNSSRKTNGGNLADDDDEHDDNDDDDDNINSLLVLDRVIKVYGSMDGGGPCFASAGGPQEVRRPVARLIRSRALRSPGSTASSAGNGGRLQIDLGAWPVPGAANWADETKPAAATFKPDAEAQQTDRDMAVVLVLTTALCMLKKEVDRRRGQQFALMAAAVSS